MTSFGLGSTPLPPHRDFLVAVVCTVDDRTYKAGAGLLSLIEKTTDVWIPPHLRGQAEVGDQQAPTVVSMSVGYPERAANF